MGTRSPRATPHRLQHLTAFFIQNGQRVIGPSNQFSLNKFFWFDHSFYENLKIQNGCQGAKKWPTGSGKWYTPRFLGAPVIFRKISFFIRALLLREKVTTEITGEKIKKIKTFLLATKGAYTYYVITLGGGGGSRLTWLQWLCPQRGVGG